MVPLFYASQRRSLLQPLPWANSKFAASHCRIRPSADLMSANWTDSSCGEFDVRLSVADRSRPGCTLQKNIRAIRVIRGKGMQTA